MTWTRYASILVLMLISTLWQNHTALAQTGTVNVSFRTHVYGVPCALDTTHYRTKRGQQFTLSAVKFYVGHLALEGTNQTRHILADHILVDANDSTTATVSLRDVPHGTYTGLTFMVGVDSIHNMGGPLDGALDPLNGMYWTWATGFIFVKVEGASPLSSQPKHHLEYHLGGFSHPHQNTRWVKLRFKRPLVVGTRDASVDVTFDVGTWLDACTIDFAKTPTVTDVRGAAPMMNMIPSAFRANR